MIFTLLLRIIDISPNWNIEVFQFFYFMNKFVYMLIVNNIMVIFVKSCKTRSGFVYFQLIL